MKRRSFMKNSAIIAGSAITSATLKFAEENNADMVCIMTEQETSSANILLGPYAQQMVNHCPIPVLSVHPKNLYIPGLSLGKFNTGG